MMVQDVLKTSLTFGDVPQFHFPVCTTGGHYTIDRTALYRVHFTLVRVLKQKKNTQSLPYCKKKQDTQKSKRFLRI